jgi:hypothetical protein
MTASAARKRANFARNFGDEADLVRALPCVVDTAAAECGIEPGELLSRGWSPCSGNILAAHVRPRGMGSRNGGRFDLAPMCAAHHDGAGERSGSKREAFSRLYIIDLRAVADGIALGHEPPLGIRGLAAKFADRHAAQLPHLVGYDLAALFAWVRRAVRANIDDQRADESPWERAHPDSDDDRHEAAVHVAHELGLVDSRQFPSEVANTLCELAGWPS